MNRLLILDVPTEQDDRKSLIRLASSMPKGSDSRRVILSSLQKTAAGVIWHILDQRAFMQVYKKLEKDDEQSAGLLYDVLKELEDKLTLSNRESQALGRLSQLVKAGSGWKPALQRNNIFKAADLLGLKLPSGMFASTKTAKVEYKQHGEMVRLTILQAGQGKFLKAIEVQKRAAVFQDKVGTALKNSGLFLRWKLEDVWIESTRGGLAFSMTFDAKLREEITDVYDRSFSKPLKDAFKSQGIAF
jgi:hypothetical protein